MQNLHTHTVFGDGKNSPEEMVLGAIRSGCRSLGFSEHSPLSQEADSDGWSMEADQEPVYRSEILRLREAYQDRLEIFLGLELDADTPVPELPYDYLIGSVHGIWRDGRYHSIDAGEEEFVKNVREHFGGDCYAFAAACFERAAEFLPRCGCQIVGHFDLVTKFNEGGKLFDENDPRYVNAALEALETVMKQDIIFEINTGAISRGYRTVPYPAPFLLKAIQKKGGRICITSDTHSASTITYAFPEAAALAESCGFREAWVLTKDGFQPVGLEKYRN
ncbi:MAG: histidinol-phosphatase [Oscillibacter sp.]|nr:histidinol-phosphatase [Oscillibacter sp.]